MGVRIYGDVWQSGTLEALSDRSVRGLSKLVANSRVSTPPALFMLVSTNGYGYMYIYMGTCMCLSQGDIIPTDGECVFIYLFICSFIVYARYTGMTGLLTLGFSSKLLASCTSGSRVVDRTCNLEGSARVGVGGGTYLCRRIQEKREAGMGGIFTQTETQTHMQKLIQTEVQTHTDMHSVDPLSSIQLAR